MRRARRARRRENRPADPSPSPARSAPRPAYASDARRADSRLREGARQILGRGLSPSEAALISKYLDLLIKWNKTFRLVGSSERSWLVENLVLDSLLFLRVIPDGARRIGDLGSGAGVPGIPIKIVRPELEIVLIESRRRAASFLSTVSRELRLTSVEVHNARAETLGAILGGALDVVVARCAGGVAEVARAGLPLLRPSGRLVVSGPPQGRRLETPTGVSGEWVEVGVAGFARTRRLLVCLKS